MAHTNEVVVYITEADHERIIAQRKKAAVTNTQQQQQ